MSIKIEKATRTIHYYQLAFSFSTDQDIPDQIRETFRDIVSLARTKDKARYQIWGNKFLFINDITFVPGDKYIKGKLLSIRKDLMPELINMNSDEIRDIDANADDGLVDSTHFIVSYGGSKTYLGIEYVDTGAKVQDFAHYLSAVPKSKVKLNNVDYLNVVRDNVDEVKRRIKEVSALTVQVHKDNADVVKEFGNDIGTAFELAFNFGDIEYAHLDLKFSMKKNTNKEDSESLVNRIISGVKKGRLNKSKVDKIQVTATDEDNNNKMALFDLLFDKLKSRIDVEKKKNSKTLVSNDMFDKMWSQMVKNRLS